MERRDIQKVIRNEHDSCAVPQKTRDHECPGGFEQLQPGIQGQDKENEGEETSLPNAPLTEKWGVSKPAYLNTAVG